MLAVHPSRKALGRPKSWGTTCAALFLVAATGCDRSRTPEPSPSPSVAAPTSAPSPSALASTHADRPEAAVPPAKAASPDASSAPVFVAARPAAERVVAVGDLHGDFDAARSVLRIAKVVDDKGAWIGGKTVLVQTGDEVDRGDDDRRILDWFEALKPEADKAGGAVIALVGNHEIMNASFDFRYVTPGGFSTFGDVTSKNAAVNDALAHVEPAKRGRTAAFAPGGAYAAMLSKRPVVAQVGDTIFVHGGVLPKYVSFGLDKINDGARDWLLGKISEPPAALVSEDGPLWARTYSAAPGPEECATLDRALVLAKAKRMVMGHTVQRNGANGACGGKAWRIDVGMSKFFGGRPQALEIRGDTVTVLE